MSDKSPTTNSRRSFIRNISFSTDFLLTGKVTNLTAEEVYHLKKKVLLRFVVASDAHYGQPNTLFDEMIEKMTLQINAFHKENPLDFCMINGDIIHNEKLNENSVLYGFQTCIVKFLANFGLGNEKAKTYFIENTKDFLYVLII